VEGVPAGLRLTVGDIDVDLARRQQGYGRGGRMAIERDRARFLAGVRLGRTLGTPIAIMVENRDHQNWLEAMSPEPSGAHSDDGEVREAGRRRVSVPRPGHADLAGVMKYGHSDVRNVLERASARETVGRVAAGAVCKRLLSEVGVAVQGRVISLGNAHAPVHHTADPTQIDWDAVEESRMACDNPEATEAMCNAVDHARDSGESLGGTFEVWCWGLCPGLGDYASYAERLDGRLAGALCSIPAVKGVEFGDAFANTVKPGSQVHDPIYVDVKDGQKQLERRTNRAAGLEGGMSNGMPIVLRAAMKPIPTLTTPLPSVDLDGLLQVQAHVERSDVAAVTAARVVGEAMVALVIAQAYREKFGGDSLEQMLTAVTTYEHDLEERGLWRRP